DAELPIGAGEVGLDSLLRQEDLSRDRLVRQPVRREPGNPQLGRAQVDRRTADRNALQFGLRADGPGVGTEQPERRKSFLKRRPCLALSLQPAENLALEEERACALEGNRTALMLGNGPLERPFRRLQFAVGGEHERAAASRDREAPGDAGAGRLLLERP